MEYIYISSADRYSITRKTSDSSKYEWAGTTRHNRGDYMERYLYLKQPAQVRDWRFTEVKQWLHMLQGSLTVCQSGYINLTDQLMEDM